MSTDLEQKFGSLFTTVKKSFDVVEFPACVGAAIDVFRTIRFCDVSDTEYVSRYDEQSQSVTFTHKTNPEDRHIIKQVDCIMKWENLNLNTFYEDLLNRQPHPNRACTPCPSAVCRRGLSFERHINGRHTGIWIAKAFFTDICAGPTHSVVIWKRPFNKSMVIFDASNNQFRQNYPSSLLVTEEVLNQLSRCV